MSFASKFNNRKFTADTTGFGYIKLADLYKEYGSETVFKLLGVYINNRSKYGEEPVCSATDRKGKGYYINLPKFLLSKVKDILEDEEAIKDINAGLAGFTIRKYHNVTYDKDCYSIEFCDINYDGDLPF